MGRGAHEFSPAETSFIASRYVESTLATISGSSRQADANRARQDAWASIHAQFLANFVPKGSKRAVTITQIQNRWKHIYGEARRKHAKLKRYRDSTGGEVDLDFEEQNYLTDAEEIVIAAYGKTPSFQGISGGEEAGFGEMTSRKLARKRTMDEHRSDGVKAQRAAIGDVTGDVAAEIDSSPNVTRIQNESSEVIEDFLAELSHESSRVRSLIFPKKKNKTQTVKRTLNEEDLSSSEGESRPKRRRQSATAIALLKQISDNQDAIIANQKKSQENEAQMIALLRQIANNCEPKIYHNSAPPSHMPSDLSTFQDLVLPGPSHSPIDIEYLNDSLSYDYLTIDSNIQKSAYDD